MSDKILLEITDTNDDYDVDDVDDDDDDDDNTNNNSNGGKEENGFYRERITDLSPILKCLFFWSHNNEMNECLTTPQHKNKSAIE